MTTINNYRIRVTGDTLGDAIKAFHRGGGARTAGMEMERFVLRHDGNLPDAREHDVFYLSLRGMLGDRVSVEPGAHMIEIKTGPYGNAAGLAEELLNNLAVLRQGAVAHDLVVADTSDLPAFQASVLGNNLISRIDPETGKIRRVWKDSEREQKHGRIDIRNWGCGTTSIQLTHSVEDVDALHRWWRVHAALMPLYFAVFENRTRSPDGIHDGMRMRRRMKERGLIAEYAFAASGGNDFVDRYVDFVLNNRVLSCMDAMGQYRALDHPTLFSELPEDSQTLGNLFQVASYMWNVCKIKPVIDEAALQAGEVKLANLLLEVRDFDVSDRAVPAIAGWLCALTESEATFLEAEERLESLGVPVCSNPMTALQRTRDALLAVETDPHYLQTPFGDPAAGTTVRDALTQIVLPMLRADADPAGALPLWEDAASSQVPPFRVVPETKQGVAPVPALVPA